MFLLLLISVCAVDECLGQSPLYYQYNTRNGLPSNKVLAVYQDLIGDVWIPSDKGITRFDGNNFKTFTIKDGLPTNEVFYATGIGDSTWICDYSKSLTYIKRDSVYNQNIELEGSKTKVFRRRYFKVDSSTILTTNGENSTIVRIDENGYKSIGVLRLIKSIPEIKSKLPERYLTWGYIAGSAKVCTGTDFLLIAIDSTVFVYNFNSGKTISRNVGFSMLGTASKTGLVDIYPQIFSNYFIFILDKPHVLHYIDLTNFIHHTIDLKKYHPQYEGSITHVVEHDAILKITSTDNFYIELDTQMKVIDTFQWNIHQKINSINRDKSGNYWISTNNEGLILVPKYLQKFKRLRLNFKTPDIINIYRDRGKWFLFDDKSNLYMTDLEYNLIKKIHLPELHKSYPEISNYWFYPDSTEGYYIASAYGVYYLLSDFTLQTIPSPQVSSNKDFYYNSEQRSLVIGAGGGLYVWNHKTNVVKAATHHSAFVRISHVSKYNAGYWCTNDLGMIAHYEQDRGLQQDTNINKKISFSTSVGGKLVYAVEGEGVYQYNQHSKKRTLILADDNFHYYLKSKDGFWVANNNYISKVSYLNGDYRVVRKYLNTKWILYDEIYNISECDSEAFLLCDKGIIQMPDMSFNYVDSEFQHSCHVSSVSNGGNNFYFNKTDTTFAHKYSNNSITIRFSSNSTSYLGNVHYMYSIAGEEDRWSLAENSTVSFPKLAPGRYEIHFKACVDNLDICSDETTFFLIVSPLWWQTVIFKLFVLVVFLSIVVLLFMLRSRKIKANADQKVKLEREIAELELSALQSQMNPHFIFNSLTSIQSLMNSHEIETAENLLQNFSLLVRSYLELSRNKSISIEQEIKTLRLYTDMEQMRFDNSFDVRYYIRNSSTKNQSDIHIPPMLIQPFVENAINHGLYHLENSDGCLKIFFLIQESYTIVIVDDNGVGRKVAEKLRGKLFPAIGNNLISERISIINQSKQSKISLTIKDKTYSNMLPAGTRVILHIKNN